MLGHQVLAANLFEVWIQWDVKPLNGWFVQDSMWTWEWHVYRSWRWLCLRGVGASFFFTFYAICFVMRLNRVALRYERPHGGLPTPEQGIVSWKICSLPLCSNADLGWNVLVWWTWYACWCTACLQYEALILVATTSNSFAEICGCAFHPRGLVARKIMKHRIGAGGWF